MGEKWCKCESYDEFKLKKTICGLIDNNDFPDIKDKCVLLKPNMLGAYAPEMHITTHPSFLGVVIDICRERGARDVWVGDAHNGLFLTSDVWKKTGIAEICNKKGATINTFENAEVRDGVLLSKAALDADIIINLPKLKTHGLTLITCAVKNMFGCIPGMKKSAYHRENIDRESFDKFLIKVISLVKPSYNIVDGIVAMEGDGPSAGKLRDANIIIAGDNPFKTDELVCKLINVEPMSVGVLSQSKKMGLWSESIKQESIIDDFVLPATFSRGRGEWWLSKLVIKLIFNRARVKPVFISEKCKKCMHCLEICPAKAIIKNKNGYPHVNRNLCFECFCCHESCPIGAIELKPTWGVRFARWWGERREEKGLVDKR